MEADLQRSTTVQSMENRQRAACHASDASIDNVVKVPDALLSKYEASCHGLGKWQKLAIFFYSKVWRRQQTCKSEQAWKLNLGKIL